MVDIFWYSDYWYIVYVKTGQEEKALKEIKGADTSNVRPFIPRKENLFRKNGEVVKDTEILFPSYVFIETALDRDQFSKFINPVISKSDAIIRLLGSDGNNTLPIPCEERKVFESLWGNQTKSIEASEGIIEGNSIKISKGALVGLEGIIKHINRHKMEAAIEFEFMGDLRQLKVGLEVVKKF